MVAYGGISIFIAQRLGVSSTSAGITTLRILHQRWPSFIIFSAISALQHQRSAGIRRLSAALTSGWRRWRWLSGALAAASGS